MPFHSGFSLIALSMYGVRGARQSQLSFDIAFVCTCFLTARSMAARGRCRDRTRPCLELTQCSRSARWRARYQCASRFEFGLFNIHERQQVHNIHTPIINAHHNRHTQRHKCHATHTHHNTSHTARAHKPHTHQIAHERVNSKTQLYNTIMQ